MTWETVIGLEIHVQLRTETKLFCGCRVLFGAPPNTQVCPICLGFPGALPVPNETAVRQGVRAALALGCEVHPESRFARKNYYYPDLPKGYQITQYDAPLATGGAVTGDGWSVPLVRLHLEEDAGKLIHDRFPGFTAIDFNRAGTPLAEIVTAPAIRSPAEARAALRTLKATLQFAGVSDCAMEEGTLRVDANLSVRRPGAPLGTKTEIKNLNSFAHVERALALEAARQIACGESGGAITQATLLYDAAGDAVRPMRAKEGESDYRYFLDPDLPPLVLAPAWIEAERAVLPELPEAKRSRFATRYGLSGTALDVLTADPAVAEYFEAVVAAGASAAGAAPWVMGPVLADRATREVGAVAPAALARLVELVEQETVSVNAAKKIFSRLHEPGSDPLQLAHAMQLIQVRDPEHLATWVQEVCAAEGAIVARYRAGETKLMGFLLGEIMKRSGGRVDPKEAGRLLRDYLEAP